MTQTEVSPERLMQIIASRAGPLVADAVVAHRANWQGIQKTAQDTSCLEILEMGEVTRRLRRMLRQMVVEMRMSREPQVVGANDTRVISMASSRQWMQRDIKAVWTMYRDFMADYRAMYDAYMFRLDLPTTTLRPIPPLTDY